MSPSYASVLRTYVDTSVFGGCFDSTFEAPSRRFFAEVADGRFIVLVSDVILVELRAAPEEVQAVYRAISPESLEHVAVDGRVLDLARGYLDAGVVSPNSEADATHVAAATLAEADVIVSWNFRHLVHLDRIRGFQSVSIARGHPALDIRSPWEVLHDQGD